MSILQRFLETDAECARELVRSFIVNLQALRVSITQAVEQQDGRIYTQAHHQAKSTLAYIDQERLKQLADNIQAQIKERGIENITQPMQQSLSEHCVDAIDELKQRLSHHNIAL